MQLKDKRQTKPSKSTAPPPRCSQLSKSTYMTPWKLLVIPSESASALNSQIDSVGWLLFLYSLAIVSPEMIEMYLLVL